MPNSTDVQQKLERGLVPRTDGMTAAVADPEAREFLRKRTRCSRASSTRGRTSARAHGWTSFGRSMRSGRSSFQVAGQQLSVSSTRAIISHLEERFGGHLPSPAELLAADPQVLRDSGFSARKGATLRALAERFADGRLSDEALSAMTDDEVEATLTEVPGIRAVDRAWVPARGSRPAGRVSVG